MYQEKSGTPGPRSVPQNDQIDIKARCRRFIIPFPNVGADKAAHQFSDKFCSGPRGTGLPDGIFSDQAPQLIRKFWKSLEWKILMFMTIWTYWSFV
jgi:hypothetical protein